jgi:hypothetical protein
MSVLLGRRTDEALRRAERTASFASLILRTLSINEAVGVWMPDPRRQPLGQRAVPRILYRLLSLQSP